MSRLLLWSFLIVAPMTASCASAWNAASTAPPTVYADVETAPVKSSDDAADDPAIWINANDPSESRVLGTDKQAGLYVYRLDGSIAQFLPSGRLNNVDVRQNATLAGEIGDYAAASNRSDDTIVVFSIANGRVSELGRFPSLLPEPYGLCVGAPGDEFVVFVAHKTGDLLAYRIVNASTATLAARRKFDTQLEGCVFDEPTGRLYVGEEERGVWRTTYKDGAFGAPGLIDEVSRPGGLVADVEGLTIRRGEDGDVLIASSQGDNSFVVYDLQSDTPLLKFKVAAFDGVDGAEETDGVDVTSASLGPSFPQGVFLLQDGLNKPGSSNQNFKFVDWRRIADLLNGEDLDTP
ncbi:MAG: phytase [Pseudomonadota bacterium]